MRLSKRLELLLSFVEPGGRVADVGTDHGFIPVELVRRAIAYKAIAMDVRPGPLLRAREHIRQAGLWERIETRLGDGVERLSSITALSFLSCSAVPHLPSHCFIKTSIKMIFA